MTPPPAFDAAVDRLYQLPLDEFVAARNQAAREFAGAERHAVQALPKPNLVAWALNQLFWSARPAFDRVEAAAGRLRQAQSAGRGSTLREAVESHREALQVAVRQTVAILEESGHAAGPDTLRAVTAALEALPWKERGGRLDKPPVPVGFAVFSGLDLPQPPADREGIEPRAPQSPEPRESAARPREGASTREEQDSAARRQQEAAARRGQAAAALESARQESARAASQLQSAEEALASAHDAEREAHERLEAARRSVKDAERAVATARRAADEADAALRKAEKAVAP
jgi:hypothetical protein